MTVWCVCFRIINAYLLSPAQLPPLLHSVLQTMLTPAVAGEDDVLHTVLIVGAGFPGSSLLLVCPVELVCTLLLIQVRPRTLLAAQSEATCLDCTEWSSR